MGKWRPPEISLVWLTTIVFLIAQLACLWVFHYQWYDRESIKFFPAIVGGAFALFAYLKKIEESRNQAADRFIERWNKPDMRVNRQTMNG